jgi:hypothetical protein
LPQCVEAVEKRFLAITLGHSNDMTGQQTAMNNLPDSEFCRSGLNMSKHIADFNLPVICADTHSLAARC